jgi:hypothetical protein
MAVEVVLDHELDGSTADLAIHRQDAVHVRFEGQLERLEAARAVDLDPGDRLKGLHGASSGPADGQTRPLVSSIGSRR